MSEMEIPERIHKNKFTRFIRWILGFFKIGIRYAVTPGVAVFGINLFREQRSGDLKYSSYYAMQYISRNYSPSTVIDVGSGGGYHAKYFKEKGAIVTCIDFGSSIYAKNKVDNGIHVVNIDFNEFKTEQKFGLVWASHVLEHQQNVGNFLDKLIEVCAIDGLICITVPDMHRRLMGGHLTLWNPGLLAYNIVLRGVDLSDALFVRGSNEFSIIFSPKLIMLPGGMSHDCGDLNILKEYMPCGLEEGDDAWAVNYVTNAS